MIIQLGPEGLTFWVLGFRFPVFCCQVSDFVFLVSGFGFWVLVSGFGFRLWFCVLSLRFWVSGCLGFLVLGFGFGFSF